MVTLGVLMSCKRMAGNGSILLLHRNITSTVSSWTLVGVVSASSTTLLGGQCGDPDSVGLAMSVAHFLDIFISDNIADGDFCHT